MSQFKFFYDNWLKVDDLFEVPDPKLNVNLSVEFFKNLKFDEQSLKSYRIEAAQESCKMLGPKPALCLSGGIDSQAMVSCWKEADLNFEVFTLVFEDDLNMHDVECARNYCDNRGIKLNEIKIDIIKFLTREHFDLGLKYKIPSPHFTTHYKLYEKLYKEGYTGICSGGFAPYFTEEGWPDIGYNNLNFIKFGQISKIPCHNFLNFYPKLAWALCLLTPKHSTIPQDSINAQIKSNELHYEAKVQSYINAGIYIERQRTKFTGFEYVKKFFEQKNGDGWAFEKLFREPLTLRIKSFAPLKYILDADQQEIIELIYSDNMISGFGASSRI